MLTGWYVTTHGDGRVKLEKGEVGLKISMPSEENEYSEH